MAWDFSFLFDPRHTLSSNERNVGGVSQQGETHFRNKQGMLLEGALLFRLLFFLDGEVPYIQPYLLLC
jgi:hypothetical protein